jgi:hypothetical protein
MTNVTKRYSEYFKENYLGNWGINGNTQLHLTETGRLCMDWIQLTLCRAQWQVLVNQWWTSGLHQMAFCNKLGCETFNKDYSMSRLAVVVWVPEITWALSSGIFGLILTWQWFRRAPNDPAFAAQDFQHSKHILSDTRWKQYSRAMNGRQNIVIYKEVRSLTIIFGNLTSIEHDGSSEAFNGIIRMEQQIVGFEVQVMGRGNRVIFPRITKSASALYAGEWLASRSRRPRQEFPVPSGHRLGVLKNSTCRESNPSRPAQSLIQKQPLLGIEPQSSSPELKSLHWQSHPHYN